MLFGGVKDIWFRWVIDLGITGPDNGEGGRYLLLPLDYKVTFSDGYLVVNSPPSTSGFLGPASLSMVTRNPVSTSLRNSPRSILLPTPTSQHLR